MSGEIIKLDASIICCGNTVGQKEYEGPLGKLFDFHCTDDRFNKDTWESAEGEMQRIAFNIALKRGSFEYSDIGALFAGDLLNQCVGSAYGLLGCNIPYFGLYGACSTCAEGIMLASILTTHSVFDRCAAITSSHNCSAERQYRTPIEYGGQRTPTSQWTVTGAGAFIIGDKNAGKVKISAAMPGRVIDKGINDANNMGAAMVGAVCDTLTRFFKQSNTRPDDYDLIITGDLGHEGAQIMREFMEIEGYPLGENYTDCGILIYDKQRQDTHAGGSGCGCSASVMSAYVIPSIRKGIIKNAIFIGSGAMMSPDMIKQGNSIPAIGHLVVFEG
ncbi:MAG: stage V sporulation protein AD [Ruminococcaceae bacterium]|nr:stage V sporulation protein AD [Oscillospiraceae bacterium]